MIENSLKPLNTFGIQAVAKRVIKATSPEGLLAAWRTAQDNNEPVLVLGEGSNVLFLEDFAGTVILNRIMGAEFTEQPDSWLLHVGAGENWHHLVERTLSQGIPGLENLAMIPGCAGSSPIQNIGAYGVELKDVCHYVDCLELNTGQRVRLPATACQFGYRDSIFKHAFQDKYVIIAIGLLLNKHWTPVLSYGDLVRLDKSSVTPSRYLIPCVICVKPNSLILGFRAMPAAFSRTPSYCRNRLKNYRHNTRICPAMHSLAAQ